MNYPQPALSGVLNATNEDDVVQVITTVGRAGLSSVTNAEANGRAYGPIFGNDVLATATVRELKGKQLHIYTTTTDTSPNTDIAEYTVEVRAGTASCKLSAVPFAIPEEGDGAFYQTHVVIFKF